DGLAGAGTGERAGCSDRDPVGSELSSVRRRSQEDWQQAPTLSAGDEEVPTVAWQDQRIQPGDHLPRGCQAWLDAGAGPDRWVQVGEVKDRGAAWKDTHQRR